jgi:hypothetical protein
MSPRQLARAEYHRHLNAVDDWIEAANDLGDNDLVLNLTAYRAEVVANWHKDNPMPTCGGGANADPSVCPRAKAHAPYPCPCGGHLAQQEAVARHLQDFMVNTDDDNV